MDDQLRLDNKWLYNKFVVKEKLSGHLGGFSFLLKGYSIYIILLGQMAMHHLIYSQRWIIYANIYLYL